MTGKAHYEIIPKLLTPQVNAGQSIEVEIFISGSGSIHKNKLTIGFPSAITDDKNPGELITCVKTVQDKTIGKLQPVSGKKFIDTHKCDGFGLIIGLGLGYFLDNPHMESGPYGLPVNVGECRFDEFAPIKLTLNTHKDASAGDHEIRFVLTYSVDNDIEASKESVKVHVNTWVERYGKTTAIIGITLTALATVVAILLTYVK